MSKESTKFASFCIMFAIAVVYAATANAQSYSGRAAGIISTVTINNITSTTSVADTCPLSSTGGSHIATTPIGLIPGIVRTGPITSTTSAAGKTSQASSTVQDLDLMVGNYRIRATSVNASAQCDCCVPTIASCTGRSSIVGLVVTDPSGAPVTAVPNGSVGQTIPLGTSGSLILNQQMSAPGDLTVNALRVNFTLPNGTTQSVIVASAHADINCLSTGPTAALVNVSGRVLDANGIGIGRATVTLTNGSSTLTTRTHSTGGYTFAEVMSGETYILEASHPSYTFAPVVLNVLDEMNDADIRAEPRRQARK